VTTWEVTIIETCTTVVHVEAETEEAAIEWININGSWHSDCVSRDYEWEETTAKPLEQEQQGE
jgi:gamma-glutamyl phosphate reductase